MIPLTVLFLRINTEKCMRLATLKMVMRIEKKGLMLMANNNGNGFSNPKQDEQTATVIAFESRD